MINLLPNDTKQILLYARRNTALRTWLILLVTIIACLLIVSGAGLWYLRNATNSTYKQVDNTKASLVAQNKDQVTKDVQDLTSDLKLVDQVLSKEVLFSKMLQQIGAVMPSGAILRGLSIQELEGAIDLQVGAASQQAATQVQVNLSDPENKVFKSADIIHIQCQSPDAESQNPVDILYPCTAQIRALFTDNNPFLLINDGGGS